MRNIKVVLHSNKKYDAINQDEVQILEDESSATLVEVQFPEEYKEYSKRVDFMNIRGEKWTTSLYAPENRNNEYDENFDKLNFTFTIPTAMAKRGELQAQMVAYLTETNTVVPFQILYLNINKSILYASAERRDIPDLVIKAYEYSNQALDTANEANTRSKHAEDLTTDAAQSAKNAENSAKNAENSSKKAEESAKNAETSASEAQASASASQQSAADAQTSASNSEASAKKAEQLAGTANSNSENAVSTSNDAREKAAKSLEIIEALTVSSEEIDCEQHVAVNIETEQSTKHKNIKFSIPAPKKGTSYRSKGVWSATENYINDQYFIDTVSIHGCTYYCKKSNTNQQPIASAESDYWGIIALKGSDAGFTIIDDLNSTHSDYVLSANQGRVLKEMLCNIVKQSKDGSQTTINNIVLVEE